MYKKAKQGSESIYNMLLLDNHTYIHSPVVLGYRLHESQETDEGVCLGDENVMVMGARPLDIVHPTSFCSSELCTM